MMSKATVTVRVSKRNFASGTIYAKRFGGKLNPDKTWEIPAHRPELADLAAYYLVRVEKPQVDDDPDAEDLPAWNE
jgi:hypothetical protein